MRKSHGQTERDHKENTAAHGEGMLRETHCYWCVSACWLACEHQLSSLDSATDRRGEHCDPDTNPW